jgi:hypothetical protein
VTALPCRNFICRQSANRILAAVRRHTGADYLGVIARLRAARPTSLDSDFIVGFPGETDADHTTPCAWSTRSLAGALFVQIFPCGRRRRPSARPVDEAACRAPARLQAAIDRHQISTGLAPENFEILFEARPLARANRRTSPYCSRCVMAPSSLIGEIGDVESPSGRTACSASCPRSGAGAGRNGSLIHWRDAQPIPIGDTLHHEAAPDRGGLRCPPRLRAVRPDARILA